jgi:predicted DNA-binding transcriptional regulator AlpA
MARTSTPLREKHLTIEELADRHNVTVWTVYRWNSSRTGPRYMKIGRTCSYKLADVIEWENSRYVGGAA